MKTLGIILITIQVLAYASGNIKMPDSGSLPATIGYLLGSNIFGIIGVLFILTGDKSESEKDS